MKKIFDQWAENKFQEFDRKWGVNERNNMVLPIDNQILCHYKNLVKFEGVSRARIRKTYFQLAKALPSTFEKGVGLSSVAEALYDDYLITLIFLAETRYCQNYRIRHPHLVVHDPKPPKRRPCEDDQFGDNEEFKIKKISSEHHKPMLFILFLTLMYLNYPPDLQLKTFNPKPKELSPIASYWEQMLKGSKKRIFYVKPRKNREPSAEGIVDQALGIGHPGSAVIAVRCFQIIKEFCKVAKNVPIDELTTWSTNLFDQIIKVIHTHKWPSYKKTQYPKPKD
jgi:hypothetical protein